MNNQQKAEEYAEISAHKKFRKHDMPNSLWNVHKDAYVEGYLKGLKDAKLLPGESQVAQAAQKETE